MNNSFDCEGTPRIRIGRGYINAEYKTQWWKLPATAECSGYTLQATFTFILYIPKVNT